MSLPKSVSQSCSEGSGVPAMLNRASSRTTKRFTHTAKHWCSRFSVDLVIPFSSIGHEVVLFGR